MADDRFFLSTTSIVARLPLCLLLVALLAAGEATAQEEAPKQEAQADSVVTEGVVVGVGGVPVEGAIVRRVGGEADSIRAVTGPDGRFSINASDGQRLRVITDRNYRLETTAEAGGAPMEITVSNADKLVPLGHDVKRKRRALTAAVDVATEFGNAAVVNPEHALYGQLPSLFVLQNGGAAPPTNARMYIRGAGTYRDNSPLVLVDGFQRPLASLTLEEIQSVSVLKDAAATAMYGVRGANGVLLVTTKRGDTKGFEVNASFSRAMTQATNLPEFVDAGTYARARNEALQNDGLPQRYSQAEIDAYTSGRYPNYFPNVDWFDQVLRKSGSQSRVNLSFKGGGATAQYFGLVNFQRESGLYGPANRNEAFSSQLRHQRLRFRTNLDIDLTEQALFQFNVAGGLRNDNRGAQAGPLFDALYELPAAAYPVKTSSGAWGGRLSLADNPVAMLTDQGWDNPNSRELQLKGRLKVGLDQFVEGLSAEATAGYYTYGINYENQTRDFLYEAVDATLGPGGDVVDTTVTTYGNNSEYEYDASFGQQELATDLLGKLRYKRSLLGQGEIDAVGLFHQQGYEYNGENQNFRRRTFAASVHTGWADTYFLDLVLSYSGGNHLSANERYTFFPAVSAGWVLSNEGFLDGAGWVDFLKLRGSWGISGSDRVPTNNPQRESYDNTLGYDFGTDGGAYQTGFTAPRIPSGRLGPEKAQMADVGLEATLFNKLSLSGDVFWERRTNIVSNTGGTYSELLGAPAPLQTSGIVENRGVEATASWTHQVGDFSYQLGGQFSLAKNKIVEFGEQFRPEPYLRRTGEQVGQPFGLVVKGFFQDEQDIENSPTQEFSADVRPGDLKYVDQNGDGVINELDEVPLGDATNYPKMYFSGTVGASYKGLSVSALFQGTSGYSAYLNTAGLYRPFVNAEGVGAGTISSYYYQNRWRPGRGGEATFPRLTTQANENNYRRNSLWMQDRSYVKLRNLQVAYALPASLTTDWGVSKAQVYVQGRDLFSLDDMHGNPEHLGAGYPLLRTYTLGVNLRF